MGNTQKTRLAALRPCWLGSGRLTPRCSGNKKLLDDKVPWKEGALGGGAGGHTLAVCYCMWDALERNTFNRPDEGVAKPLLWGSCWLLPCLAPGGLA